MWSFSLTVLFYLNQFYVSSVYEPADIGCVIYTMPCINFLNFYHLNVCMVCVMQMNDRMAVD